MVCLNPKKSSQLSSDSVLQRAFDLMLTIRGETVTLKCADQVLKAGAHALAVLDVFATPKTLAEGLAELSTRPRGMRDWIRLNNEVLLLAHRGFIRAPNDRDIELPSHSGSFSSPDVHIRMLNDQLRTLAYQEALRHVIKPTDVVVDIGTGTGILAASAAMAGARHVYAVERTTNMPKLARAFFKANGLEDRVTLIEGDSTRIELPERADVMVSEIIGNDPLSEGVLSTTADARKRLLKQDARIVPSFLSLYALPLTAPDTLYEQCVFTSDNTKRWEELYRLDFSSYSHDCTDRSFSTTVSTGRVQKWPRLASPILLAAIDLNEDMHEAVEVTRNFAIEASGVLNCVILYFEAQLSPEIGFSIHPDQAGVTNSWASWTWLPGRPLVLSAGQRVRLDYRFDVQHKSGMSVSVIES